MMKEEMEEVSFDDDEELVDEIGKLQNTEIIPIEMQHEEVDMNDPLMDPLEWSFRKIVPIPKSYFWDTKNHDIPFKVKMWHHSIFILGKATRFVEKTGGIVADATGINSSRYEYVTSTMTKEEWSFAKKNAEEQKSKRVSFLSEKKKKNSDDATAVSAGFAKDVM